MTGMMLFALKVGFVAAGNSCLLVAAIDHKILHFLVVLVDYIEEQQRRHRSQQKDHLAGIHCYLDSTLLQALGPCILLLLGVAS